MAALCAAVLLAMLTTTYIACCFSCGWGWREGGRVKQMWGGGGGGGVERGDLMGL
jgi:hypothetical protein